MQRAARHVQKLKHCLPAVTSAKALREKLTVGKALGSGRHGRVYAATQNQAALALKCMPLSGSPDEQWSQAQQILNEIYAVLCCSKLAKLGCPHFPKLYRVHLLDAQIESWRLDSEHTWCVVMEQCEGTLVEFAPPPWLRQRAELPVSIALQMLCGFYMMGRCFGVCNNDAYARNVLFTPCADDAIQYRFGHVSLRVPTFGYAWKLIDFGLSTNHARHKHPFAWRQVAVEHPCSVHVSLVEHFPRFGRDASALLSDLTHHFADSQWLRAVNYYLDRCLRNHTLDTAQGLLSFVQHIAAVEFLRATAVPECLFAGTSSLVCDLASWPIASAKEQVQRKFRALKETMLEEIFSNSSPPTSSSEEGEEDFFCRPA